MILFIQNRNELLQIDYQIPELTFMRKMKWDDDARNGLVTMWNIVSKVEANFNSSKNEKFSIHSLLFKTIVIITFLKLIIG